MLYSSRYGLLAIFSLALVVINVPTSYGSALGLFPGDSSSQDGRRHGFAPGKLGAVASESSICSGHGTEMLKMGGNAADAVSILDSCHEAMELKPIIAGCDSILHWRHW